MIALLSTVTVRGDSGSITARVAGRTEAGGLAYLVDFGHGARRVWVAADRVTVE